MGKGKKLGKDIGLMTIGTFGSKLLTFFLVPLYTSCLSTSEYGIADLITTTISLLFPLFTVTIGEAVLRYALDKDIDRGQVFSIGVLINTVGFIVLLAFSPLWLKFDFLNEYYIFFLLYYLSYVTYQFFSYFAKGIDKVTIYTISGICQTVTTIITNVIALIVFNSGIEGYLLSFIVSNTIAALVIFIFADLRSYFNLKTIYVDLVKEMLTYSFPMIPNSISWWVSNSSDKYILKWICGATITGIYSVSYKIPTILSIFYNIFLSAWRLSAVDEFGSKNSIRFHSEVLSKLFEVLCIVAAGIILMNKYLAKVLYANDFYQARMFVPILVIAVLVHGIGEFYGTLYTSAKQTKMLFYSSMIGALANISLNIILIPKLAGMGAAAATLISYFVILLFRAVHTRKIMKLSLDYRKMGMLSALLLIMSIIQTLDRKYSLLCSVLLFVCMLCLAKQSIVEVINIVRIKVAGKKK